MFRIDQPTNTSTLPTPATALTQGYFTGGNPATGAAATILDSDWLNRVQEELMSFLTSAGYAASKTTYTQVANAIQSGSLNYAGDSSGTPNTVTVTLTPVPPSYKNGLTLIVKIANTNSGATNVNVNGLGNIPVQFKGSALVGQELQANQIAILTYNSGVFQLVSTFSSAATVFAGSTTTGSANAQACTTTPTSYTLVNGNIVTFTAGYSNSAATTLNVESTGIITIKKNGSSGLIDLVSGDIVATDTYQVQYNGTYYVLLSSSLSPSSFFQVTNNLSEGVPATMRINMSVVGKINVVVISSSGTYTPSAHLLFAYVRGIGGGGAGGGVTTGVQGATGGGGSSGAVSEGWFTASAIGASQTVTIGAGGTGVNGGAGNNGGTTSFGSLMTCPGGIGGALCLTVYGYVSTPSLGGAQTSVGSGGNLNLPGAPGGNGHGAAFNNTYYVSGAGGNGLDGVGGGQSVAFTESGGGSNSSVGVAGANNGSGGGGAGGQVVGSAISGGAGGTGLLVIFEFLAN